MAERSLWTFPERSTGTSGSSSSLVDDDSGDRCVAMKTHDAPIDRTGRQLVLLGVIGALTSAYGVYVEHQKLKYKDAYSALCDSDYFSCSKVMTSEYGSLLQYHGLVSKGSFLDVPNALLGVFAYLLFVLYPILRKRPYHQHLYLFASMCALAISAYLAYILSFVLRDFCLVCVTSYVVNIGLFWNSLKLLNDINGRSDRERAKKTK